MVDPTEREQSGPSRRASDEGFRELAEAMPHIVWTADADGRITYINRHWTELTGLTLEQTNILEAVEEVFHPDDAPAVYEKWRASLASGEPHDAEWRFKRKSDGTWRWFLTRAVPVRGEDGRIREWFGTATDIDEQKRTEEELRAAREQLQIVTDAMPAAVVRMSRDMRYLWISRGYSSWIGSSVDEMLGRHVAEVLGIEAFHVLRPHIERVLRGERVEYEVQIDFKALGPRWIYGIYMPTLDDSGTPDGYVAVVMDVTRRRQAEEALKEADRRKDEFLATLAHELRNPLAPLANALEILRRAGDMPAMVEKMRGVMARQLQQMVRLIDDLLDLSRVSHGTIELRKERAALAGIVRASVETSRPLLDAAGHDLAIDIPVEPIYVQVDVARIAQVISNLLNNAAKYTEDGGRIRLTVARRGNRAMVSVKDNGVGISEEMLPRIFDMFVQAGPAPGRLDGGLGIGLTIVRRLVEMHGGTVEARSDGPGKGSEFTVFLPALPALGEADAGVDVEEHPAT